MDIQQDIAIVSQEIVFVMGPSLLLMVPIIQVGSRWGIERGGLPPCWLA